MTIHKKRIRNVSPYLQFIKSGDKFSIGIKNTEKYRNRLTQAGFDTKLVSGDTILPSSSLGPVSLFNAEGKYLKRADLPMETAYSQRLWHWEEFHGPYEKVPKSKIVDVPYKRYPRDFVPPPSVQLHIKTTVSGDVA